MKSIETYLFDLLLALTKDLSKQKVFSTTQGTRYTNEGLQTYIVHEETQTLYRVIILPTTVEEELSFLKSKRDQTI